MIVGIDGHMIGDNSGGNESYYSNILERMVVPEGDTFILFLKKGVDDAPYRDQFQIVRFKSSDAFKRNFIELPKLCKEYQLDLLHVQYFIPFIRPCPIVTTIHDISFEHYKNIFTRSEYIRQKLLIPYAAKKASAIFTVSENAKKDIINIYHISEDKIIVTDNAVNDRFRKLDASDLHEEELRGKYGIGPGQYILTVGNLQPRKNLPRLIEAFRKFSIKQRDYKLVIVGKKAWMYEDILKSAFQNDTVKDRIILTDYVTDEDLVRLYNAAQCFIYPSFFEGFGIPPLEAMACGVPVIVSNASSLPEVVGEAGVYFDPFSTDDIAAAIEKTVSDEQLRAQLMSAGFERAKRFSWTKSAQKVVETYESVVAVHC